VPARTYGRITTRSAFAELQRSRARGSCGPVRAAFVPADEGAVGVFPQVAYAIGRGCGGAVVRNRLRRRAREVVRSEAPALRRGAYLLRFEAAAVALDPSELRHDVAAALHGAAARARVSA
jgi:ribonuclease P protein component